MSRWQYWLVVAILLGIGHELYSIKRELRTGINVWVQK